MFNFELRRWCEGNGITISDVAREARQTLPVVRRYWYGDTASYDRAKVAAIFAYLKQHGATLADLFTVDESD